ncbi:MAG: acylneuraminate cytidylyltransferase family protein [Methylococcaceae bacterium]|nr:acylneuraminate cytidylyltransferase family protein [Methylococcaceae bacterium]
MLIKTFIIIPARSGSKGIPDKNIKLLGGKPLIAWTAEAIKTAKLDNCLAILSTDSNRYAEVGLATGLAVPFIRPPIYAEDSTSTLAVAEHALQWFEQKYHYLPEQVMLLQPTSPFRAPGMLNQALEMMQTSQADGVIGCKEIHRDLTTLFNLEAGFLRPLSDKVTQTRRQDIAPLLTPNGALYLCKTAVILEKKSVYAEKTLPLVMDAMMSLDIDTLTDWAMAEAFVQAYLVG